MCVLLYHICSKCYCGYPRFTEYCSHMHPPLIYCPWSTQFKFQFGDENLCFLHPHHGLLPRLGGDSEDTVASIGQSGHEPAAQTASQLPVAGDNAASDVAEVREAASVGHINSRKPFRESRAKSIAARDKPPEEPGGYRGTKAVATSTLPDAYSQQQRSPSARNQRIASPPRDHPQGRASNARNKRGRGNKGRGHGTSNNSTRDTWSQGKSATSSGNEHHTRAPFGARQHTRSDTPYQYPYQAATIPHFQGASGSSTLPVYDYCNNNQQYQYQVGAPPNTAFPLVSDPAFPDRKYCDDTRAVSVSSSRGGNRSSSFNPEAAAFEAKARGNSVSVDEQRRQNLEQLRRSNDAAYNCSNHGKSLSVSGTSADDDGNREVRTSKSHSPPAGKLSAKNAHHAGRTGDDVRSRPRSWSESYPRLPSVSRASSVVTREVHSPMTNKEKEKTRISSTSCTDAPPPVSTAQDDSGNTGKETDKQAKFLRTHDVEETLEASLNPIKMDPHSPAAHGVADEAVKSESTRADNASARVESDVSIKKESDDEECKLEGISEWASSGAKTDAEVEVTDDSHSEVGSPRAPPNSPVHCVDEIHKRANTFEPESPSATPHAPSTTTGDDASLPESSKHSNIQALENKTPETPALDASNTAKLPAPSRGPNTGVSVQKSWSAVVSGRYVPSEASRPHPRPHPPQAAIPATPSSIPCAVAPADNTPGSKTAKPATPPSASADYYSSSSTPATAAGNKSKRPGSCSNAPPRSDAPPKTWASLVSDAASPRGPQQKSAGPETDGPKRRESRSPPPPPPPPPPPHPASRPASPPARRTHPQEMPSSIWEREFPSGPRPRPGAAPSGPDSASVVSDDSVAATEGSAPSARPAPPSAQSARSATPAVPGRPGQAPAPAPQKPRLWSQVLLGGADSRQAPPKSRSESSNSNNEDARWPSLGSGGPAKRERKRNSSS
ncbi:hypothetical protein F5X97DRAFT_342750 [Nemania serpens]|nr:hypothetical protein F5X97DRAFT_342750 [Nemania serpens]